MNPLLTTDPFWSSVLKSLGGGKLRGDSYLAAIAEQGAEALEKLRLALRLRTLEESAAVAPVWPDGEFAGKPPSIGIMSKLHAAARQANALAKLDANALLVEAVQAESKRLGLGFNETELDQLCSIVTKEQIARSSVGEEIDSRTLTALIKRSSQHLDREKFEVALKSKIKAGLDAVAEAFKGSPEAMELYQSACKIIEGKEA